MGIPGQRLAIGAIGASAAVIMAGNLTSSVLGFFRQAVIADVFGQGRVSDSFFAASLIPQMFYDLTIGAAVSAALIPTFTEIMDRRGRKALGDTIGPVLVLCWLVLAILVAVLVLAAHPIMQGILAANPQYKNASIERVVATVRLLVPSLLFLGTSAVFLASLYSVRRFTVAAFASGFYHVGIIAGGIFLARPLGVGALAVGAVAGAAAQALIQLPALLRWVGTFRLRLQITPELRRIIRLYLPVAAGLIVSLVGQIIDLNFKWQLGGGALTSMQFATTLTQFPIGIAVAALSFAILPSISADIAFGRMDEFKQKLATGLRFVLFLTIPAAVGYLALSTPIVALIFEHGKFRASGTHMASSALIGYAIQIPFVGIDQLLIFAFYARRNTVTPMLIGILGVGIYVVSALLLRARLHVLGLALANTIQNSLHGLILLGLLLLAIGSLRGARLFAGLAKTCLAAGVMGVFAGLLGAALTHHFHNQAVTARLLEVSAPILLGAVIYVLIAALLRSEDLRLLAALSRRAVSWGAP